MGIWINKVRGKGRHWPLLVLGLCLLAPPPQAEARQGEGRQAASRQKAEPKPTAPKELDVIVAVVNDDVIVRSELEAQVQLFSAQSQGKGTPLPARPVLERQVLDRMIGTRLQLQRAKQLGIEADDARVMQAITSIAERNNMSVEQLSTVLASEGINFNQFREDTRLQLITGQLQAQEVVNRVGVTEQEVDLYLKNTPPPKPQPRLGVHMLHLLVPVSETASAAEVQAAKKRASQLVAKVRGGTDFAEAVAAGSAENPQPLEGGDLGWLEMGRVPTVALEAARGLERGPAPGQGHPREDHQGPGLEAGQAQHRARRRDRPGRPREGQGQHRRGREGQEGRSGCHRQSRQRDQEHRRSGEPPHRAQEPRFVLDSARLPVRDPGLLALPRSSRHGDVGRALRAPEHGHPRGGRSAH